MGKAIPVVSVAAIAVSGLLGCSVGSGSAGTSDAGGRKLPARAPHSRSRGVGQSAPISKVIVARQTKPWHGHRPGVETIGARPCMPQEGRGEIGIYTDVAAPSCVRVTSRQRVMIVNPIGVLVLPKVCAILQPEPGEPLCFEKDRSGRLRRWHRTEARLHAPACRGADLVISAERHSGVAAGTVYSKLTITNSARRPCTVAGVPRVAAIDRRGKPVGRAEAVPTLRPGSRDRHLRVRLRGGESATFTVAHNDGIGSGRCELARTYGLRVTVPGTEPTRVVPLPLSYCPSPRDGLGLRVGRIE